LFLKLLKKRKETSKFDLFGGFLILKKEENGKELKSMETSLLLPQGTQGGAWQP